MRTSSHGLGRFHNVPVSSPWTPSSFLEERKHEATDYLDGGLRSGLEAVSVRGDRVRPFVSSGSPRRLHAGNAGRSQSRGRARGPGGG